MIHRLSQKKGVRYALAGLLLALTAVVDYLTGREVSSSALYFFPIYMVASHPQARRLDAAIIALCCGILWFLLNAYTGRWPQGSWVFVWNGGVRMAIFLVLAVFIYRNKKERRRVEEANTELTRLNEEKNKYLGVAAHDIRSPLGSISNLAMLLLEDKGTLTVQQHKMVSLIQKLSTDGLDMLNNILDIAQIEAGSLKVHPVPHDYIYFVREVVENNRYLAEKKGQHIEMKTEDDALNILYDESYLNQVLNNLLTNAIKYSHADSTIIVLVQRDERQVITTVIDRGIGIQEEDKRKVFRPFEKAQNKPTAGEYSSGLGLAITNKIVEAHQGTLSFTSEYGKGSRFCFSFPLIFSDKAAQV